MKKESTHVWKKMESAPKDSSLVFVLTSDVSTGGLFPIAAYFGTHPVGGSGKKCWRAGLTESETLPEYWTALPASMEK